MAGCSQMEKCWGNLILQSGQLLENKLETKMSRKAQNGSHLWTSTFRKKLASRSLSSCIKRGTHSASSVSCPQRSIRSLGWNSSCLGWETLVLATKHGWAMVVFLGKDRGHLASNQHLLGAFWSIDVGLAHSSRVSFSASGPAGHIPSDLALFLQLEWSTDVFLLSRSLLGFAQVLTKMTVAI